MRTSIEQLRRADWERMTDEVVRKIALLRAVVDRAELGSIGDKVANELLLPAIETLAAFCGTVEVEEDGDDDGDEDLDACRAGCGCSHRGPTPTEIWDEMARKARILDALDRQEVTALMFSIDGRKTHQWHAVPGDAEYVCTNKLSDVVQAVLDGMGPSTNDLDDGEERR